MTTPTRRAEEIQQEIDNADHYYRTVNFGGRGGFNKGLRLGAELKEAQFKAQPIQVTEGEKYAGISTLEEIQLRKEVYEKILREKVYGQSLPPNNEGAMPNAIDVIKKAYEETHKVDVSDTELNEEKCIKAYQIINEIQDILGIYIEGDFELWNKEYVMRTFSANPEGAISREEGKELTEEEFWSYFHKHEKSRKPFNDIEPQQPEGEGKKKVSLNWVDPRDRDIRKLREELTALKAKDSGVVECLKYVRAELEYFATKFPKTCKEIFEEIDSVLLASGEPKKVE